jgi:GWxTD domain-containing protein
MKKPDTAFFAFTRALAFLALVGWVAGCSSSKPLSKQNFDYQIDKTDGIGAFGKAWYSKDSVICGVEVVFKKYKQMPIQEVLETRYFLVQEFYANYHSKKPLVSDTLKKARYFSEGESGFFWIKLKKPDLDQGVLVVSFIERTSGRKTSLDFNMDFALNHAEDRIFLMDASGKKPMLHHYIRESDTVMLKQIDGRPTTYYLKYFPDPAQPSLPPMVVNFQPAMPVFTAIYPVSSNQLLTFSDPGLYLIQEDTNRKDGLSLLVMPNQFPQYTMAEELITPLIYITTRDERTRLADSKQPKEALDNFWLKMGENKEIARKLIRWFYEGVEYSNQWFSFYKEGWKTDQGMIYTIFGKPDKVTKTDFGQEWLYTRNASFPQFSFYFDRKPSVFTQNNYELRRFEEYERFWYPTVEQWRKATVVR